MRKYPVSSEMSRLSTFYKSRDVSSPKTIMSANVVVCLQIPKCLKIIFVAQKKIQVKHPDLRQGCLIFQEDLEQQIIIV